MIRRTHYVSLVDALIPEAIAHADKVAGPRMGAKTDFAGWAATWNKAFHGAMDRATMAKGLRRQSYQAALHSVH